MRPSGVLEEARRRVVSVPRLVCGVGVPRVLLLLLTLVLVLGAVVSMIWGRWLCAPPCSAAEGSTLLASLSASAPRPTIGKRWCTLLLLLPPPLPFDPKGTGGSGVGVTSSSSPSVVGGRRGSGA